MLLSLWEVNLKQKMLFLLLIFMLMIPIPVNAADSNMNGGGGSMGQGNADNKWTPGREGVRVTIIRENDGMPVTRSVDFAKGFVSDIDVYFSAKSKIDYRNGTPLSPQESGYKVIRPKQSIPKIIKSSGGNNIKAVKKYFCDEIAIRDIADATGFDYETLINGNYRILVEPMAFFKYDGIMFAMTATEAALYDQKVGGGLRRKIPSLSHKNLPFSMFLEISDLGFPAWTGGTDSQTDNENIISSLGLGIVRFMELPPEPPMEADADITYRCDTDVITSVILNTGSQKTPEDPAYAVFHINGQAYAHENIYLPENGSQYAWVKWHTPSSPDVITITVESNCKTSFTQLTAQIVDMDENEPPDPQANDRNDTFSLPGIPDKETITNLSWGEWDCWWQPNLIWESNMEWVPGDHNNSCPEGCTSSHGSYVDHGKWVDKGWYEYEWIPYAASYQARAEVKPDEKSPTASGKTMKSGYGLNLEVQTEVRSNAPASSFTPAQTAVTYFPEFGYETYWRLLENIRSGNSAVFQFKVNQYSTYGQRCHFLPVWYPDGPYTIFVQSLDAWTPAGMLQMNLSDSLLIQDNLFSDWHIKPER